MADMQTSATTGQESATHTSPQGAATPQAGKFEAAAVTPQAGNSGVRTPSAQSVDHRDQTQPNDQNSAQQAAMSLEEALDALKKERAEAARYRKRAQEMDAREKQEADAKLSETERLQQQLAEMQAARDAALAQSQARIIRSEVRTTASALGIKPELAQKLIDTSAILFNDDGDPTNISELLSQAMTDYGLTPAQAAAASQPLARPNPTQNPTQAASANGLPRAAAQSRGATNPGANAGPARGALTREQIVEMAKDSRTYAANRQMLQEALRQLNNNGR